MKVAGIVIFLTVVAVALWFIFGTNQVTDDPQPASPTNQSTDQLPADQSESSTPTVNIANMAFSPSSITVKKGATVTWVNQEGVAHRVVSDEDGLFASDTLQEGDEFSFTFDSAGSFAYHCGLHPGMTGTVWFRSREAKIPRAFN